MKSKLEDEFLACLKRLPDAVRQTARKNYRLWLDDPKHPSLAFKQIGSTGVWSVRVGIGWRALGLVDDDTITWFWIGSHADYDTLVKSLRWTAEWADLGACRLLGDGERVDEPSIPVLPLGAGVKA